MKGRRKRRAAQAEPGDGAPDRPAGRRGMIVAVAAAVFVAAFIAYLPSLGSDFINWDDPKYVTENPPVSDGLSWTTVAWAFSSGHASNWHPLTWLSHALDVSLYGLDRPWGHHLTNLLLHAANAALLLVVLWRLTRRLWPAAVVAALFALHPLHVESVAWVSERKDLLCTLFMLLTVGAYTDYVRRPSWPRYLLVVLALAAALLSKPMAVTLPLVLLLLDYWPLRRLTWRAAGEKLPLLAMAAASSVITFLVQQAGGAVRELERLGLASRAVNAAYAYGMYLVKAVWPRPGTLVPYYPLDIYGGDAISPWPAAGFAVALATVTVLAVRARRRRPYVLVGWLLYLVMLLPVIGLVQVGRQVMADRYTYVPLTGVMIAVVWWLADLLTARPQRLKAAAVAATAVALAALGGLTWHQQALWRTRPAFWQSVIAAYPRAATAQNNLGDALMGQGRYDKAIEHLAEAVRLEPRFAHAHANLGTALSLRGRPGDLQRAVEHLATAVDLDPALTTAHHNLATCLARVGDFDAAIERWQKLLAIRPDYPVAQYNLATALARKGRAAEAKERYEQLLEAHPDYLPAMAKLAWLLATAAEDPLRDGPRAVRLAQEACRLTPRPGADLLDVLAAAYAESERFDEAARTAQRAVDLARDAGQNQQAAAITERLLLYRSGRPWREPPPGP